MLMLAQSNVFAKEYHGVTTIHPLGLTAVLVLGAATLALPRRWAIAPMIVMACFVAPAQRIVVGGLDFNLIRILVLFGWIRLLMWQEWRGFRWQAIDYVVIAWGVVKLIAYTALRGDADALVYMLGTNYDIVGMYFFFRCIVRDWEDVRRVGIVFAVVAVPVAAAFVIEKATGRNGFSIFGGVPEITRERQGKLRAQGAYPHAIIAGCFWAAAMPFVAALWWNRRLRQVAVLGVGSGLLVVVACASSTPIAAVGAGILAAVLFPLRHWMSWIRIGTLGTLVFLHFAMNKPVWHLVARIDLVGGSTGWHRYHLIDRAIANFSEWAVIGTLTTGHWGHQLFDVTNQYVLEGVRGGFVTLVLFLIVLGLAFAQVGLAWRSAQTREQIVLSWAIGVSLFVHAASFIAVSYFGQAEMVWMLSLALAASVGAHCHGLAPRVVRMPTRDTCVGQPQPA